MRLVTFNIASIDGRIGVAASTPSRLDPRWKPLDRFEAVDIMAFHGARVSLQGSNSFAARDAPEASFGDHAGAAVPGGDFLSTKLQAHAGRWLVAIDSRARVIWDTFEVDDTYLAVLLSRTTPAAYRLFLREHDVPYIEAGEDRVDLGQALRRLDEVFGVDCIVSDAGGVLNGALLRAAWSTRSTSRSFPLSSAAPTLPPFSRATDAGPGSASAIFSSSQRQAGRTAPSSSGTPCADRASSPRGPGAGTQLVRDKSAGPAASGPG